MQSVTHEQAQVIEKVLEKYKGDKAKAAMNFAPNAGISIELFTRCMIDGYEVLQSKEDQIRAVYLKSSYPMRHAIEKVLAILEVKVEGVSGHDKN